MQINVRNAESMNIGIHLILDGIALTVIIELTRRFLGILCCTRQIRNLKGKRREA
jgi:hypothetical protein